MKPPKEYAKELFSKFYAISGNHPAAKKSCLICVREMYNLIDNENWNDVAKQDYCIKLRQEIELL